MGLISALLINSCFDFVMECGNMQKWWWVHDKHICVGGVLQSTTLDRHAHHSLILKAGIADLQPSFPPGVV